MIKLPRPVVVAGSGGEQPETVSQRTQSPPRIRIMILMVDFDAVQSVITSQRLQHARWKQALAAATPRVGDHRRFADRRTQHSQLAEDAGEPTEPAVADSRHLSGQFRTCRISTVRQDV